MTAFAHVPSDLTSTYTRDRVALVCTTLGRWSDLAHLLSTAAAAARRPDLVVVVDQSHESERAPLATFGLDVVVRADDGRGVSRGRNRGIDEALRTIPAAEVAHWLIGFPDDDVWFDDDTLASAVRAADGVDFVSGCLVLPNGAPSRASWPSAPCALNRSTIVGRTVEAATFIRASVFATGIRYNESFGVGSGTALGSGEGLELLFRVTTRGSRGRFAPDIRVFENDPPPSPARARLYAIGEGGSFYAGFPRGPMRLWRLYLRPVFRAVRAAAAGRVADVGPALRRARDMREGAREAALISARNGRQK